MLEQSTCITCSAALDWTKFHFADCRHCRRRASLRRWYDKRTRTRPPLADNLSGEEWRPVIGFEDHYAVSNFGRVKRLAYGCSTRPHRLLNNSLGTKTGYWYVSLSKNNTSTRRSVHTLVMQAFVGPPPEGHQVNHIDGDKTNPHLENLEYVTVAENAAHARRIGLVKGISWEVVQQVRALRGIEWQRVTAARFGIASSYVCRIQKGQNRVHS